MGYSVGMVTKKAPDLTPGYPSNGAKLGPAWNAVWRALERAGDFRDGRVLADRIAPKYELEPATLVALMSRAAKAGLLAREGRPVKTGRGTRTRTHYMIDRYEV